MDYSNKLTPNLIRQANSFSPPASFSNQANISNSSIYSTADDFEPYWASWAKQLTWDKPWHTTLNWQPPFAQWFVGGLINASVNCLDRHIQPQGHPHKTALIWEGEPGDKRILSYLELYQQVNQCANTLQSLGVTKGSRVAICLPMIPEAIIAILACARLGAIHSVIFAGLGIESIQSRINDLSASHAITADYFWRRGKKIHLYASVNRALEKCPSIKKVIIVNRDPKAPLPLKLLSNRDIIWQTTIAKAKPFCPPAPTSSEDVLFVLYTSGTTGRPKGLVHTTGGYLTQSYATTKYIFDIKPDDIYWCTADIGWITGHSYVVYGPLANGATVFIYEGAPDWPDRSRFWKMIDHYKISIFYTAPTAIRMFMQWGNKNIKQHSLNSLRLLGTVGEPINPAAWHWYYQHIGQAQCPIVDTWWQTETGSIMISPLPGITNTKPGSATKPFPGISAAVLNSDGQPISNQPGYLAITKPWPSMSRTIWRDDKRYLANYWSKWNKPVYFTGDYAIQDKDGYFWILGRADDVIQVAGHRLSSAEIEGTLVDHPNVAEAAVISIPDPIKGEAIIAFVTLQSDTPRNSSLTDELIQHVSINLGPIAKPKQIVLTAALPKTRSGKIMRRLLRNIATNQPLGNTSTLADPTVIDQLTEAVQAN